MKLQVLDIQTIEFDKKLYNPTAHCYGEPYWIEFVKPHLTEIGVEVLVGSLDQIDKSKNWFVNVAIHMWNWDDENVDIISGFPSEVQNELIHGNAYLILNHECESITQRFFNKLYLFLKNSALPPNKIIYMVGAADADREYQIYVKQNNLSKDQQIQIMKSFHVYKRFQYNLNDFECDPNVKKEKRFLSLNRLGRMHRVMLVGMLSYYDLINQGFVSLGIDKNEMQIVMKEIKNRLPVIHPGVLPGIHKIIDRLPLKIDDVDLKVNQFETNSLPSSFYEKSYFSLVSSTSALKIDEPSIGFTEKEIKPILYKHPFIIYNLPGALKSLREMGFLTFDKWFDESYDDEEDDIERLSMIVLEVKRLSEISDDVWNEWLIEMQPTLLHNYNRLVKYTTEHSFFNSDLKDFLYYVAKV
jgi:hypothetical protein